MLVTPGPLLIQPNDRGDGLWLKDPARPAAAAVATVWRQGTEEFRSRAAGNARVMAHAGALYELARRVAGISGRADGREVTEAARALLTQMESEEAECPSSS